MGYSKITSVEVYNFMIFSHAIGYFDDSGIINIKGYNNSGKSTILKAIVVCLLNMYPKSQTKFIRHGEKYFRVVVNFDDGVSLTRDKYISGQSLYEMYKNGERIFSTKEGERLTKVDEVPQPIQDYLGLCVVNTGCLNYQVRQDPLWLIDTTGSENYTAFNEILKSEELSRANALLNSDKNQLNSEITLIEASLQETKLALVDAREYSEGLLYALQNKEELCKGLKRQYEAISSLYQTLSELGRIRQYPEVEKLESHQYEEVQNIASLISECAGMIVPPMVEGIEIIRMSSIEKIADIVASIPKSSIPEVCMLDYKGNESLLKIYDMLSEVLKCNSEIKACNSELKGATDKLESLVAEAKDKGIRFVKCDNCGTYIEVENEGA